MHHTTSLSSQGDHLRGGHLPSWQRSTLTDKMKGRNARQLQPNPKIMAHDRRSFSLTEDAATVADQEKVSLLERRLEFLRLV